MTLQTAKKVNKHVYICATIANYCFERYVVCPYCVTPVYTTVVHLCSRKEYANRSMVKSSWKKDYAYVGSENVIAPIIKGGNCYPNSSSLAFVSFWTDKISHKTIDRHEDKNICGKVRNTVPTLSNASFGWRRRIAATCISHCQYYPLSLVIIIG